MSEKPSFVSELKRRNVYKVAVAYIVAGWALSQGIAQVFPVFDVPNWAIRIIVLLIMLGFPLALVLAWAFELTPEGLKRTEDVDPIVAARAPKKHLWIYVVAIGAALSIGLFFLGRYTARNSEAASNLPVKSIAVLPFENLSPNGEDTYFTEGMQIEIVALELESRSAGRHFQVRNLCEGVEYFLGNAITEVGGVLVVAQIFEWQNRDRFHWQIRCSLRIACGITT